MSKKTPGEETAGKGWRPFLGAALLSLLGLLAFAGLKSYHDLTVARQHRAELESKIEAAEQRIESLRGRLQALQDDPLTLERLAREDLGMVRPGDIVIVLPEESPVPTP